MTAGDPPRSGRDSGNSLDMVTMMLDLQNQIIEIRESKTGETRALGAATEMASLFNARILAQRCEGISNYQRKIDPAYHMQYYDTWMTMQDQSETTLCQAFCLTLS